MGVVLALLHNHGLNRQEICIFNDLFQFHMKRRLRYHKTYSEILEVLVKVVVEEVKVQQHDYTQYLHEAIDRIDKELQLRYVGASLRKEITEKVWDSASEELAEPKERVEN